MLEPAESLLPARTVYLRSYDLYVEVLRYQMPEGTFAVISRDEFDALGLGPTCGPFTREGDHVAGVFAWPDGPVFFVDGFHVVGRFGSISARVEATEDSAMQQFFLEHETASGRKHTVSIRYRKRFGIGTNPYDNDEVDVDLFAMLAAGMRGEQFFRNYTHP